MSATTTETDRIVFALDTLLRELIERRAARVTAPSERLTPTPFSSQPPRQIPTREESEVNAIIAEPLEGAYRIALRKLGQRLYDITKSIDFMRDVMERVAARDPERSGVRVAILDSVWNGVGADGDRWWS